VFAVFLYWLCLVSSNKAALTRGKRLCSNVGLFALLILILVSVRRNVTAVFTDIRLEMSSSKVFGEWLNGSERFRDAILVPEPDYYLESLPYYAKNRIYLARENRFGAVVSYNTTVGRKQLSLGELVGIAGTLRHSMVGRSWLCWDTGMSADSSLARGRRGMTRCFRGMRSSGPSLRRRR